jgi:hypothetical protein
MTMSLPLSLHPSLADVSSLDETVDEVLELHAEHARLRDRIVAAEDEFIRKVAQARQAGKVDWKALVTAYDQVRAWSRVNGLGSFVDRWEAHIQYDRNTLARFASSMPTSSDGTSWTGNTGWEGLGTKGYPQRGMHVAFVLFGNGNAPVHIGFTEQFRNRLKSLAKAGLTWESWLAQLCDARQDALEVRRELVKKYGEPNVAAHPVQGE